MHEPLAVSEGGFPSARLLLAQLGLWRSLGANMQHTSDFEHSSLPDVTSGLGDVSGIGSGGGGGGADSVFPLERPQLVEITPQTNRQVDQLTATLGELDALPQRRHVAVAVRYLRSDLTLAPCPAVDRAARSAGSDTFTSGGGGGPHGLHAAAATSAARRLGSPAFAAFFNAIQATQVHHSVQATPQRPAAVYVTETTSLAFGLSDRGEHVEPSVTVVWADHVDHFRGYQSSPGTAALLVSQMPSGLYCARPEYLADGEQAFPAGPVTGTCLLSGASLPLMVQLTVINFVSQLYLETAWAKQALQLQLQLEKARGVHSCKEKKANTLAHVVRKRRIEQLALDFHVLASPRGGGGGGGGSNSYSGGDGVAAGSTNLSWPPAAANNPRLHGKPSASSSSELEASPQSPHRKLSELPSKIGHVLKSAVVVTSSAAINLGRKGMSASAWSSHRHGAGRLSPNAGK
jgi:hypothetical protein